MPSKRKQRGRAKRRETEAIKVDARLMKALSHPMRVQIMAELNMPDIITSPSKFSKKFDLGLSKVNYHFEELRKFGCLEIAEERPVRGSTEHFYRASKRILFHSDEWSSLPEIFKNSIAARALCDFLHVSREAIEAGTFAARDDSQFCWATIRVDERGWVKAVNIVADALETLLALQKECEPRIEAGAEALSATIGLGAFESPCD
jgi:DNA-binding transcriptional ArsR family regulator